MDIEGLIKLLQAALNKEGSLEVVTTGHYGEPFGHSKHNFYVKTIDIDPGISPIKPKKVFNIEFIDIGPEPD